MYETDALRRSGRLRRIWPAQVGRVAGPDGSRRSHRVTWRIKQVRHLGCHGGQMAYQSRGHRPSGSSVPEPRMTITARQPDMTPTLTGSDLGVARCINSHLPIAPTAAAREASPTA